MDLKGYLQRNRTLVTFSLLVTFSVLSLIGGSAAGPREAGMTLLGGIQRGTAGIIGVFNTISDRVRSTSELREENRRLRERVEELELQQDSLHALRVQVRELRETLEYSETLDFEHVNARVIGRDPANVFPTITINRGRRHDIERNMPVIAIQDGTPALVGRVLEAGSGTAKVLPLYDANSFVAALHQESRYQGLVAGTDGRDFRVTMEHLSREAADHISEGDRIVTSGMRSLYPPNIAIGTVTEVSSVQFQTSIEVYVRPLLDFHRLEHVYVLTGGGF